MSGLSKELKHQYDADNRVMFGFWIYMMTDLLMFGVLFATYAVLSNATAGGPSGNQIFDLTLALSGTLLLLVSSFTSGLGILAARQGKEKKVLLWFGLTFLLGLSFFALEMVEFRHILSEGYSWQTSAFLSSFFTLVATHGIHIICGLIWIAVTMIFMLKRGLTRPILRKLTLLSIYWHFLDVVWIFIFTIVYLRAFL